MFFRCNSARSWRGVSLGLVLLTGAVMADDDRIQAWRFFSEALQREMPVSVVVPERPKVDPPVLVFLHGRGRHHRSLLDVAPSREQLLAAGMWVIFPQGEDGWYTNSPVQPEARYEDYLGEVIEQVKQRFELKQSADRWAIGGWSMGGYGAVRYATRHPMEFGTLVSVIGVVDFPGEPTLPEGQNYTVPVDRFGEGADLWRKYNPIYEVGELDGKAVMLITAEAAFDRTMNENFSAALDLAGIAHRKLTLAGGHTFAVVQESLQHVLGFVQRSVADD